MSPDDRPVGSLLSRREALTLLGATGFAALSGYRFPVTRAAREGTGPCVVRPAQTEGPYFVDESLHRSDIRTNPGDTAIKPGLPLDLMILVSRLAANRCEPLAGVQVDVWHCDHLGVYSDVRDPRFDTVGQKFLRGYQVTDAQGQVRFTTIYPGWYEGRTVHIHFKIRSPSAARRGFEFTSQLYFDDAFSDQVFARAPYAGRKPRSMHNDDDGIFGDGGRQLLLEVTPQGGGYATTFHVALQGA